MPQTTQDRIVQAAYRCFERYGIRKTTIEDLAHGAGITRATVYKYFSGKQAIVNHLVDLEIQDINARVRQKFVRGDTIEQSLTECLLLIMRAAADNPYLRNLFESIEHLSTAADIRSDVHQKQRDRWGTLLEDAIEAGELAADLTLDDIVSWLTQSEQMLLIKLDSVDMDDDQLRHFIRRMIIFPLLPHRTHG